MYYKYTIYIILMYTNPIIYVYICIYIVYIGYTIYIYIYIIYLSYIICTKPII